MRVAVVVFPGSNCDHDLYHAYKHLLGYQTDLIWHHDRLEKSYDLIALPGGFSYGDYLRAGALAALSPFARALKSHITRGGYVLGICNGFQILTEMKVLPGALTPNRSGRFICSRVYLKVETNRSFLTRSAPFDRALKLELASASGAYHADEDTIHRLEDEDRILFRYSDKDGRPTESANLNGSLGAIAGVLSADRRVAGMMPHPERASEAALGSTDGRALLSSVEAFIPGAL